MNVEELISLIQHRPDADVGLSFDGHAPVRVDAIAQRDSGEMILMGLPNWPRDELEEQLSLIKDAASLTHPTWLDTYYRVGDYWKCKEHDAKRSRCPDCIDAVRSGWHSGFAAGQLFCNKHAKAVCDQCDTFKGTLN